MKHTQIDWISQRFICSHPLNSSAKVFAMLQAYMDDSGTHAGAPICIVAGYWGGLGKWRIFEHEWKRVLNEYKVDEFHAKIFWGRDENKERLGPYKGWSDDRRHEFLDKLLRVIESIKIYPFANGVVASEWEKRPLYWRQIFNGASLEHPCAPDHPMFMSFRTCIVKAARYCKPGISMHFVMDSDRNKDGWASICYADLRRWTKEEGMEWADSYGELTFADSKKALPLQAADLLAYEANKYMKYANGNKNAPMVDRYKRALTNAKHADDFWLFDKPRLDGLQDAVRRKGAAHAAQE